MSDNNDNFTTITDTNVEPHMNNSDNEFMNKFSLGMKTHIDSATSKGNMNELNTISSELDNLQRYIDVLTKRNNAAEGKRLAMAYPPKLSIPSQQGLLKPQKPKQIPQQQPIKIGEFYTYINKEFITTILPLLKKKDDAEPIYTQVHRLLIAISAEFELGLITSVGSNDQTTILKLCDENMNKHGNVKLGATRLKWMILFHNAFNKGGSKSMNSILDSLVLESEDETFHEFILDIRPTQGAQTKNASVVKTKTKTKNPVAVSMRAKGGGKKKKTKKNKNVKKTKKTKKTKGMKGKKKTKKRKTKY